MTQPTQLPALTDRQRGYLSDATTPWKMRLFLWTKLPTMAWWGARVEEATAHHCVVSLPYGWRTRNPFKSIYFAAQSGVGELASGLLVTMAIKGYERKVAMYVIDFEAQFTKKATERIFYRCDQGEEIRAAVDRSVATGTAQVVKCPAVGRTAAGREVGRVTVTWSVKVKN